MSENNKSNRFARKLKDYRVSNRLSQEEFARKIGISMRTYQNYESGRRYPQNMDIVNKIANALGTTVEDLLGAEGGYIVEAGELGNLTDQRRMEQMVTQLSAMFAGGDIDEESKEAAMAALNEAYWRHKTENRQRYTPKKYRKDGEGRMSTASKLAVSAAGGIAIAAATAAIPAVAPVVGATAVGAGIATAINEKQTEKRIERENAMASQGDDEFEPDEDVLTDDYMDEPTIPEDGTDAE